MREWNNFYNPFNSAKILVWREWLEGYAKEEYLPPVACAIDLTTRCNLNCIWCNAYDIRKEKHFLEEHEITDLVNFLSSWGVKANCIAGGGEPLMSDSFNHTLDLCYKKNISNSVITNGVLLTDSHIKMIAETCKWIGISVDSGSPQTYAKVKAIKNGDLFNKVIENIKKLRSKIDEIKSPCTIGYKFLIHPYNQTEIYETAKLAKSIGVNDFQLRPVGWDNLTITKDKEQLIYAYGLIDNQIDEAMKLESNSFHVYGIRHKFNEGFKKKMNFSRCWAIPIHPTFASDGKLYICLDMRGNQDLVLCDYLPYPNDVLKHWNTLRHKEMIRNIDISKCPRCTFAGYNEVCEQVFVNDNMCRFHI